MATGCRIYHRENCCLLFYKLSILSQKSWFYRELPRQSGCYSFCFFAIYRKASKRIETVCSGDGLKSLSMLGILFVAVCGYLSLEIKLGYKEFSDSEKSADADNACDIAEGIAVVDDNLTGNRHY